jgi:Secretion system C-terminal sorting domain/Galactose oxidase, central domain
MKLLITSIIILAASLVNAQDIWIEKDSLNGAPRSVASSFVASGEAYVLVGLDQSGFRRKMYSYTFWQDDWDDESSLGGLNGSGLARGSASAFSINGKGYVCLGQGVTNPFFKDLWEFDPVTNAWSQKADFLGSARRQAVGFAIGSFGYVGTGIDANGFQNDMYKYDPSINSWSQLNPFGGTPRKEAVGFTMGDQGYIGTGDDGVLRKDFWQYEPATDTWTQKPDFPGTPRKGAVGWGIFPQAYITTGEDNTFAYTTDLWEYNYFSDTWVQRADFIGAGRSNAIAFVVQGVGFVGTGYDGILYDDLYGYTRIVELNELDQYASTSIYPNPATDKFHIGVDPTELKVDLYSLDGKLLTNQIEINKVGNGFDVQRGSLPSGKYLVRLSHSTFGGVYESKIVFI